VLVDAKPGLASDLADDWPQPGIVDLTGSPAARADDVVMVSGLAADVCVLAGREVETLDGTDPLQDLEGPEDRGAANGRSLRPGGFDKLCCGEVAVLRRDEGGQ